MPKHQLERKNLPRRPMTYFPFGTSALTDEISELRDQFRRMFGEFPTPNFVTPLGWAPAIDITEANEEVTVKAELPGVKKEDVKVMFDDGMLTIQGEKREEKKDETRQHHVYERSYGSFARSFTLPNTIDDAHIKAEFDDGVLTVHLPKTAEAKKTVKNIEIAG